jgi:hypothetical protein
MIEIIMFICYAVAIVFTICAFALVCGGVCAFGELSASEQAEQDKEDLLAQENRKQYGGVWYSNKP